MKPVIYDPEAKAEVHDAASYYEGEREGLGEDFIEAVRAAAKRIRRMPKAFTVDSATNARKCVLRRFPYNILFLEREKYIWIAAVAHHRQRPGYWRHRKPE